MGRRQKGLLPVRPLALHGRRVGRHWPSHGMVEPEADQWKIKAGDGPYDVHDAHLLRMRDEIDMIPAVTKPRMIEIHDTASSQDIIHLWTGANISQIADGFGDILRPFRSLDKAEPVRLKADPPDFESPPRPALPSARCTSTVSEDAGLFSADRSARPRRAIAMLGALSWLSNRYRKIVREGSSCA